MGYRNVGSVVSGGGLGDVRGLGIVEGVRDVRTICFSVIVIVRILDFGLTFGKDHDGS